jgi:hypothetical protein
VKLVGEGELRSGCYSPLKTEVKVTETGRQIHIYSYILEVDRPCLMDVRFYSQEIDLGSLPTGDFTIWDGHSKKRLGHLKVEP